MTARVTSFSLSRFFFFGFLVASILAGGSAFAAAPKGDRQAFTEDIVRWEKKLDAAEAALERPDLSEEDFDRLRAEIEDIHEQAVEARFDANVEAAATRKLLDALGPAPAEGERPESAEVANQRNALKKELAAFEDRVKQADLITTQARDLLGEYLTASRERLATKLLVRGPSPVLPEVWAKALPEFAETMAGLVAAPLEWLVSGTYYMRGVYSLAILIAGLLAAALIGWPLRRWLLRRFGRDPMAIEPSYMRRILAAAVEGVGRGLLPALAVAAVYVTLLSLELFAAHLAPIAAGICLGLIFFILTSNLARAALAPDKPQWQLAPFHPENAIAISRVITVLAAVAAFVIFVHQSVDYEAMSVEFRTAFTFVTDGIIAVGLILLLRKRLWERAEAAPAPAPKPAAVTAAGETITVEMARVGRNVVPVLRLLMILVAVAIPAAALFGYFRLAAYLTSKLVWTAALFGGLYLLHGLLHEVIELTLTRDEKLAARMRRTLTLSDRGVQALQFWSLFGVKLVLILAAIVFALPIWGVSWQAISGWMKSTELGGYLERLTFSITDILSAILVFVVILIVTRWIQRSLEERIFPQTRLDTGVRHSLKAAVGYVGLLIAGISAVSVLGLDLTSLTIVAGALSVGIGFGLQSIASNFVSGIILLLERPIKVGDWIVVGEHQGFVRRIAVRATEIETFQRANVIIPNSEILSTAVKNLTHRDRGGRIDIPVGVAYGSDVPKVKEVLLKVGRAHPNVVRNPPPAALLMNFGESSLDFELRVHVEPIERYWTIWSDLHYAIEDAFRDADITIPFPQRDLHLKDLDRIKGIIPGSGGGADGGPPGREAKKESD